MRFLILSFFISSLSISAKSLEAEKNLLCAYTTGIIFQNEVSNMPYTDKTKHCSLSCIMAVNCRASSSLIIGVAKEAYDLIGPGQADLLDIRANIIGIKYYLQGKARNNKECKRKCIREFN